MDAYQLPAPGTVTTHEIEIKRSRFITLITRAPDTHTARDFINQVKAEYPDARHHCSAFIHHVEGAQLVERFSDDGEPSGTAGKPMMEQLKGSGMIDIVAVVVRYFGGIKLGAGGLVHAYSNAVGETLPAVPRVVRARKELYTVELGYEDAGKIESDLRARDYAITDVAYGAGVTLTIAVDPGALDDLSATIAALTAGEATPKEAGLTWVELPVGGKND